MNIKLSTLVFLWSNVGLSNGLKSKYSKRFSRTPTPAAAPTRNAVNPESCVPTGGECQPGEDCCGGGTCPSCFVSPCTCPGGDTGFVASASAVH